MSLRDTRLKKRNIALTASIAFNALLFFVIAELTHSTHTQSTPPQTKPLRVVEFQPPSMPTRVQPQESTQSSAPRKLPDLPNDFELQSSLLDFAQPSSTHTAQPALSLNQPTLTSPLVAIPARVNYSGPTLLGYPDLGRYYPRVALDRGIEGSTTLRLEVDALGNVTSVSIASSTPPGVFDDAARRLGKDWLFSPATRDGKPVPSTYVRSLLWQIPERAGR